MKKKWIRVGKLIDGTGAQPKTGVGILVSGQHIEFVGKESELPSERIGEAECYNAHHLTAIPGLIDSHVHLVFSGNGHPVATLDSEDDGTILIRATYAAERALLSGITTLRDCGDRNNVTVSLREAIRREIVPGPDLLVSGMPITTTAGHLWFMGIEADSVSELSKAVRSQAKAGVDFIKICGTGGGMTPTSNFGEPQYSLREMSHVVREAHVLRKRVSAHVHATEGIRYTLEAGIDTIEHCSWLSSQGTIDFDESLATRIADSSQYVVITVGSERKPLLSGGGGDRPEYQPERFEVLRKMWDLGIKMSFATDSGVANTQIDGLALSLEVVARYVGLPRLSVLSSATGLAAKALGIADRVGTLQRGKLANISLVAGDPLDSLLNLQDVEAVFLRGRQVVKDGRLLSSNE